MKEINNSCEGKFNKDMMVISTERCPYNCSFCIAKNNNKTFEKTNVEEMIKSTIEEKVRNIMIQGGESLLEFDNLMRYIKGIKPYVSSIYLTTALLYQVKDDELNRLLSNIDGMIISLHHYDNSMNNEILKTKYDYNRFNTIQYLTKKHADKITISCNLVKGYINNKEEVQSFIDKMNEIGVKNIKFTELQGEPDLFVKFEDFFGKNLNDAYVEGCNQEIDNYLKKNRMYTYGINVRLKRVCFLLNDKATASYKGIFKYYKFFFVNILRKVFSKKKAKTERVLYNNGKVYNGFK